MNSMGNQRPCRGTVGERPCRNDAASGSLYCAWHDPLRVEERKAWSAKGGKASATERRLSRLIANAEALSPDDTLRLLSGGMLMVLEGRLEPSHLSALASAARTLDGIRTTADLQQRLEAVEAALAHADYRRHG
jgi:hypothetical protein